MTQVVEPFPIFYDDDGSPLDNGMIYVGEANQDPRVNPVTVYTDEARTIPIAQPIHTLGGRPAYQGAPVNLFINEAEYSIAVQNKRGAPIVSAPEANSSVGNFSFIQAGTGAVRRSAQSKMRETVSPEDFGAVSTEDGADPTASQSAAFVLALQTGRVVDCGGKSYVIGASVSPTDNTIAGLINGNFVRAAANQTAQDSMFDFTNQANILVDNCSFDFGTTEDTGSDDDSSRRLLAVGSNDENSATWIRGVTVTRCTFTGDGNGTAIFARGLIGAVIKQNLIFDRVVDGTATNDAQNGIDISWGRGNAVRHNFLDGLYYRVAGVLTRLYSRGILATEQFGADVSHNHIYNVDQAIDFSGAITTDTPEGNTGCNVSGNVISDVRTWGIKFANCARDTYCGGNVVRNFGFGGIVFSGQSATWTPAAPTKATSYLTIEGNYIFDPTDYFSRTDCKGIWGTFTVTWPGYPVGVRILNNTIRDSTGGARLLHGVALTDNNGVLFPASPYNEVSGNIVTGQTGAPTIGCYPDGLCVVTADNSQSINNATLTAIDWNVETVDGEGMHSTSSNAEQIVAQKAGWYLVTASVAFAANATGIRSISILKNGGALQGGWAMTNGSADATALNAISTTCIVYMAVGDALRVEAYQTSGGALNVLRVNSQFSARRIEQMGQT